MPRRQRGWLRSWRDCRSGGAPAPAQVLAHATASQSEQNDPKPPTSERGVPSNCPGWPWPWPPRPYPALPCPALPCLPCPALPFLSKNCAQWGHILPCPALPCPAIPFEKLCPVGPHSAATGPPPDPITNLNLGTPRPLGLRYIAATNLNYFNENPKPDKGRRLGGRVGRER